MPLAIVYSRAISGISAPLVTVEAHIAKGMPSFQIVGLPETAVKESRDRVRSALLNSGFEFPSGRRITVNLAPADLPKEGGRFDLPIALGILAASKQIPQQALQMYEFVGELALSGELRAVRGILPVLFNVSTGNRHIMLPHANAEEAAIMSGLTIFSAKHLLEVCAHLKGNTLLPVNSVVPPTPASVPLLDLADVYGQPHAKRALEVAAAGKHSILLIGPPGTGKTMLALRLPSILPPLDDHHAIEIATIASMGLNGFDSRQWRAIPFRSPHHSSSGVALVGGGRPPRPGEISLAHHGVLFLDELPEFNRHVIESLREPLESGCITISRAAFQITFPAEFQLVAAMNPCPCGYAGSQRVMCHCTREQVRRYMNRLSGPLLDRIDMQIEVPSISSDVLSHHAIVNEEKSATVAARVIAARKRQLDRQQKCNHDLAVTELKKFCILENDAQALLSHAMDKFNLSARVYHRIIKVARTIADLSGRDAMTVQCIGEALGYRCLDRVNSER